jgi:hypothetical protein
MLRSCSVLLLASSLLAQHEIVHYTFDSTDTTEVLNWARGPVAAPAFGTTTYPESYTYAPGRFGSALQASPYMGGGGNGVYTHWYGPHQGAATIAFFLKNAIANSVTAYSPVAGQPGWSIATGGSAGPGLQLNGWGGAPLNGDFGVPLCSMTGWNHFAIVVDPQAATATWYRNGVPATVTAIPASPGVTFGTGQLYVGLDYVNWCGSMYDIDEFRLLGRAATPAEIAGWAQQPSAAMQTFGVAHDVTLAATTLPLLGNAAFVLDVDAPLSSVVLLAGGFSYTQHGALALPFDLGAVLPGAAGRQLLVAPVATAASLVVGGEASFALPIPQTPSLGGAQLFLQTIGLGETGVQSSAALALRVGH